MSTATTDELVAASRARNRPQPLDPIAFWATVWGAPALAAALVAWKLVTDPLPTPDLVSGTTWVALASAVVLILGGELLPVIGTRFKDPTGVSWSTPFAFALLIAFDALPAVILLTIATLLSGLLDRHAPFRLAFNAGQYGLSIFAADAVLHLFGVRASLDQPWHPSSPFELLVCLLAAVAYFLVNEVVVSFVIGQMTASGFWNEFRSTLLFEISVNGSQLAMGPMVAAMMVVSPLMTILAVIPVAAIHLSAAGQMKNEWAALHDDLTGLANRSQFNGTTRKALRTLAEGGGQQLAILLLDLDRFKEVNDVLGHATGDRVLQEVASRLTEALPAAELVARLGGDEFTVLLEVPDAAAAVAAGEAIGEVLRRPYTHDGGQLIDIDASVGIAMAPEHGLDLETLLSRADVAMYTAKREQLGCAVFDPTAAAVSITRLGILGSLRRALELEELYLEYQPKIDLASRHLVGVEALVRWRHPSGVTVPPDEFIPAAEQSGLMPQVTDAVLEMALTQCAGWRRQGLEAPVAVNVSLRDLLEPDFVDGVAARLRRHAIPPSMLTLEVTERVLAHDLAGARRSMVQLKNLGVVLSMDDFGTGWSSLLMLRTLPVDEVKLDRSFVSRAVDSDMDQAIVAKIAELAHALGLTVVAEGVETAQVLDRLTTLGCDQAQGWHVARPMAADVVVAWSEQWLSSPQRLRVDAVVPAQLPRS